MTKKKLNEGRLKREKGREPSLFSLPLQLALALVYPRFPYV